MIVLLTQNRRFHLTKLHTENVFIISTDSYAAGIMEAVAIASSILVPKELQYEVLDNTRHRS